jgi:hypothetical protein
LEFATLQLELAVTPRSKTEPLAMMEINVRSWILANRELALDRNQLLALHRTNATLPEFAILKLELAATPPRTMEQPATMEMLALRPILANLDHALARTRSFVLLLINVTMLEFATLRPELAAIPRRPTILLVMTIIFARKRILANLEFALDRAQLLALLWINVTLLAFAIPQLELAAILSRPMERPATMRTNALRPILANREHALAPIQSFALLQTNVT